MLKQHSRGCRPKLIGGQGEISVAQDEEENNGLVPFVMM